MCCLDFSEFFEGSLLCDSRGICPNDTSSHGTCQWKGHVGVGGMLCVAFLYQ